MEDHLYLLLRNGNGAVWNVSLGQGQEHTEVKVAGDGVGGAVCLADVAVGFDTDIEISILSANRRARQCEFGSKLCVVIDCYSCSVRYSFYGRGLDYYSAAAGF